MADTNFSSGTVIASDWLNDVNNTVYGIIAGTYQYAKISSGGSGGTAYSDASYLSRKTVTDHAWYSFIANDSINYAGGAPVYGRASYNDNTTTTGSVASDHFHSFQAYPHYGTAATLGRLSTFWSQMDVTAGTVTEASGLHVNNPLGAGTITNLYGVKIDALTRGTNNWGVYCGAVPSFFGSKIWLGSSAGPQNYIEYNTNLGHLQLVPRPGFAVKIGADAGDRKLRFGDPTTDSFDATIENAAGGNFVITPRSGFRIQAASVLQVDAPLVVPTYTVTQLTGGAVPAADYPRGIVYCSNETGGATLAFSDGTNWRRVQDRNIVS